jgi:alpha-N-acetylglucosaminidase
MKLCNLVIRAISVIAAITAQSTDGILDLVKRRLPDHVDSFTFRLFRNNTGPVSSSNTPANDEYIISSSEDGKLVVEGNSLIALASG